MLQSGPGDHEAVLVFGQRGKLAVHQRRPASRAGAYGRQVGDLGQREPDIAQEQHHADCPDRRFGVTGMT